MKLLSKMAELRNNLGYIPFEPRKIEFHQTRKISDFRLKIYSVLYETPPIEWASFEEGFLLQN